MFCTSVLVSIQYSTAEYLERDSYAIVIHHLNNGPLNSCNTAIFNRYKLLKDTKLRLHSVRLEQFSTIKL